MIIEAVLTELRVTRGTFKFLSWTNIDQNPVYFLLQSILVNSFDTYEKQEHLLLSLNFKCAFLIRSRVTQFICGDFIYRSNPSLFLQDNLLDRKFTYSLIRRTEINNVNVLKFYFNEFPSAD